MPLLRLLHCETLDSTLQSRRSCVRLRVVTGFVLLQPRLLAYKPSKPKDTRDLEMQVRSKEKKMVREFAGWLPLLARLLVTLRLLMRYRAAVVCHYRLVIASYSHNPRRQDNAGPNGSGDKGKKKDDGGGDQELPEGVLVCSCPVLRSAMHVMCASFVRCWCFGRLPLC